MVANAAVTIAANGYAIVQGDRAREAADMVGMDLAATELLDLDANYKLDVAKHYEGSIAPPSVVAHFRNTDGSLTAFGKENLPKLQAACDAGRSAALEAIYCDDPKAYVESNPKIKDRLEHDIAFSKGWDEVMFIRDNDPDCTKKLETLEQSIKARDGWSGAASIPVRG
jgi:hypothetical protein